jgi:hypothetical protein
MLIGVDNDAGLDRRRTHARMLSLAFDPQIASFTAQVFTTPATTVSVTRPATNIGDRWLLFLNRSSASSDAIAPTTAGWNALDTSGLTGSASNFCRAYYQDVDSAAKAAQTTVDFSGGTSTESTSLLVKLTGCDFSVAPVANGVAQGSNAQTVDPASLTGPNAGAVQRNIFIAYVGTAAQDSLNGATPVVTGFPAGYTNTGTSTTTDAAANSNGCGQGWGSKIATAGSDDPSAWTYGPNQVCRAFAINIAVRGVIG